MPEPVPDLSAASVLRLAEDASLEPMGEGEGAVLLRATSGELYSCNDTTLAFLQALDGRRSIAAVADLLVSTFEVDSATLTADLVAVARDLVAEGLVETAA